MSVIRSASSADARPPDMSPCPLCGAEDKGRRFAPAGADLGGPPARCGRGVPARKLLAVPEQLAVAVGRRAARAILIDDRGRLILIRRTKPGQPPYWTAPGGGVENGDGSVEAALRRELAEELGAEAAGASRVLLYSSPSDSGVAVQYFFVARLVAMDETPRGGPELAGSSRGGYDVDRVDMLGDDLAGFDLKPGALKEFIMVNREALLAEAAVGG